MRSRFYHSFYVVNWLGVTHHPFSLKKIAKLLITIFISCLKLYSVNKRT